MGSHARTKPNPGRHRRQPDRHRARRSLASIGLLLIVLAAIGAEMRDHRDLAVGGQANASTPTVRRPALTLPRLTTVSSSPGPTTETAARAQPRPVRRTPLRFVAAASWTHDPQGYRLHLRPTRYGRAHAKFAPLRTLREALKLGRPTPVRITAAIRDSLTNQLLCHADFVPDKPIWNLETWRPNVGFAKTVLDECNP